MATKKNMFSSAMNSNLAISQPISAEEEKKENVTNDRNDTVIKEEDDRYTEDLGLDGIEDGFAENFVFEKEKKDAKHARTIFLKDSQWKAIKEISKKKDVTITELMTAILDKALGSSGK